MRVNRVAAVAFAMLLLLAAASSRAAKTLGYDPAADPFALLEAAESKAADERKLVLLIAGGEWCVWCHYLAAFLDEHPALDTSLKDTFVVVKAYYGDEADNEAFFATLPEAAGYPHFWILSPDGTVLESQNTLPLEDGDNSYDAAKFTEFIATWRARAAAGA